MELGQERVRLGVRERFCCSSRSVWTPLSDAWPDFLGGLLWSHKLDTIILVGPFQFSILYDRFTVKCSSLVLQLIHFRKYFQTCSVFSAMEMLLIRVRTPRH